MREIVCERYPADDGPREIVLVAGAGGSRLLIDRSVPDQGDARLLAHLAPDEPDANARLVCCDYLRASSRHARALTRADFRSRPEGWRAHQPAEPYVPVVLTDAAGRCYALRATGTPVELRWTREARPRVGAPRRVSARDVVGALEDYEPVCALTRSAVARFRDDRRVSIATLAVELRRVETSPIVLNRKLREAVLEAVRERGTSLSAIAMACGRVKYDRRGNHSGETSWLARRVGLLPSAPDTGPNPWVHSATLALIAREGLGLAPREVELP